MADQARRLQHGQVVADERLVHSQFGAQAPLGALPLLRSATMLARWGSTSSAAVSGWAAGTSAAGRGEDLDQRREGLGPRAVPRVGALPSPRD